MKKTISAIVIILININIYAQINDYGLHIKTFPLKNDEFTSMSLDNGELIDTKNENITLQFNLFINPNNVFGSVFRIITDNNKNIDLVYSVGNNDKRFPILVTGDMVTPMSDEVSRETWVKVSLTLNPKSGFVNLNYDNKKISVKYPDLINTKGVRIIFGHCTYENFINNDVASVTIKDISLMRNDKKIRLWRMANHNEDICYDEISHKPAKGKNTQWIIDKYITWKHLYSKHFDSSPSIAFNSDNSTFYFSYNNDTLYEFNANKKTDKSIIINRGKSVANYPNQLIYIQKKKMLLSYNLNENIYSYFDFSKNCWISDKAASKEHDYWNNTLNYNPEDSSLVSFGGYGHYHYNNKLVISYPFNNKPQESITIHGIDPRYSCSSTIIGSNMYIFGGRGCPSGRQELSPKNYYDLYSIDLHTQQVKKIWEFKSTQANGEFQPGESLIYDNEKRCFYTFCTQAGGTLMKFSLDSCRFETMSLPLGIDFNGQYLYTNIFYSKDSNKLFLAILQANVNNKSKIDIYEIDYPPMPISFINQADSQSIDTADESDIILYIIAISTLSFIGLAFFYRRRKKNINGKDIIPAIDKLDQLMINEKVDIPYYKAIVSNHYDYSKKCICFFGGFRTIDKDGIDITASFSPTLKYLLILLILYTAKDSNGISGNKMIQLLWFDKNEGAAKNNRNVYMSKLRNLLDRIGDIKIINHNGLWSIEIADDILCDYMEAMKLYNDNINNNINGNIEKLLELLLHGMMLPNTEADWIDTFKSDFSNNTIDLLSKLLLQEDLSDSLKLQIADTIFQHDFINEEALCIKCKIMSKQGKNGIAKTVYDSFCKEYYSSFGTKYKSSFYDIVNMHIIK